jgi:RHS repeat-associated protein
VLGCSGTSWYVRQRIMSGGLDQPLVTRLVPSAGAAARNMAFIADRQGTTLAAVHPSGLRDETAAYFGRNVFGQLEGASGTGSSSNPETGFTGASTPNQTGGFTYLRNRWYDPQSGRFLTQDPIGLAGGVNLYAYAGNNPVSFSDPFGLCTPPDSPACQFITGVAGRVAPLERVVPAFALAEAAVLAPMAAGLAGGVGAGATEIGAALNSSSSSLLQAAGVATRVASAVGGTVSALAKSEGFKVTVGGAKDIVARIKTTGDMRVSIDQMSSLTRDGILSSRQALTHLTNLTSQELIGLIEKAKEIVKAVR